MFLVADRREFGFMRMRRIPAPRGKKAPKLFDLLARRMRGTGAFADESHHVHADLRQQLIKKAVRRFSKWL
jgi:hypothetical protein